MLNYDLYLITAPILVNLGANNRSLLMKKRYTFSAKTWLGTSLITAVACTLPISLQAQTAPPIQWDKTFGGNGDDGLYSLQQTTDGGYILAGHSSSGKSGDKSQNSKGVYDYWVIKLDGTGNKTWDKTFGGDDSDDLISIQQTSDGGYILGGSSISGSSGNKSQASQGIFDYWIVKLDAKGNRIWDKTFGGDDNDYLSSVQQTSDGGYILGGYSLSNLSGDKSQQNKGMASVNSDYWIVKLDANGNKIWDKTFGGSSYDDLKALEQTADGGYILGGNSASGISEDKSQAAKGPNDYWLLKLDANGNKTWDTIIDRNGYEMLAALHQTSDGGYILGGNSTSPSSNEKKLASDKDEFDYWIVKLDADGNKTWDKTIGGSGPDFLRTLQQTADGGYILGGTSFSGISGDKSQACQGDGDYWIVKLDADGNKIWDKTMGGNIHDELVSIRQISEGTYILGGYSGSGVSGDKSQVSRGNGYFDYWVVKLGASVTGIKEAETGLIVSIYPNPGNGKFNLQLSNLTVPSVRLIVSDMLGRVVLEQELQVSDKQISRELTLPSTKGTYLLQFNTGNQTTTRKVVVE